MFEVLVFVYENYWRGDACPELDQLGRKLSAAGFETDEIDQALQWLAGLNSASRSANPIDITPTDFEPADVMRPASVDSMRIYATPEQDQLGADGLGFLSFLESAGVLPAHMREIVIDRAMAVPQRPIDIDDLKIIVLMVYWSAGIEPDALVLDELCDDNQSRVAH
jgi:Smg protein